VATQGTHAHKQGDQGGRKEGRERERCRPARAGSEAQNVTSRQEQQANTVEQKAKQQQQQQHAGGPSDGVLRFRVRLTHTLWSVNVQIVLRIDHHTPSYACSSCCCCCPSSRDSHNGVKDKNNNQIHHIHPFVHEQLQRAQGVE